MKKTKNTTTKNTNIENVNVESEVVSSEVITNHVESVIDTKHTTTTIDMVKVFEKVKKSFFVTCTITLSDMTTLDLNYAFSKVVEFYLTTFTFNVDQVYVMSRTTFLNTFCKMFNVSPTMSKFFNKSENKTLKTYGTDVVGVHGVTFDVDKYYELLCMVKYSNMVVGGVNVFYCNEKVFFMSHTMFENFVSGGVLNDLQVNVIASDLTTLDTYKKSLTEIEIVPSEVK